MTPAEVERLIPLAAELIGAACAGHLEPLWDATVDGENEVERIARQTRGLAFCRRCPGKLDCAASIDVKHDDGIRGGIVLPTIPDRDRRAVSSLLPGRGGIADLLGLRETCGDKRETLRSGSLSPVPEKTSQNAVERTRNVPPACNNGDVKRPPRHVALAAPPRGPNPRRHSEASMNIAPHPRPMRQGAC